MGPARRDSFRLRFTESYAAFIISRGTPESLDELARVVDDELAIVVCRDVLLAASGEVPLQLAVDLSPECICELPRSTIKPFSTAILGWRARFASAW